jgi:hypothetical protein
VSQEIKGVNKKAKVKNQRQVQDKEPDLRLLIYDFCHLPFDFFPVHFSNPEK